MPHSFWPLAAPPALAGLLAFSGVAAAQAPSSPWGLRNILRTPQLQAWSVPEFEAEFAGHQAGHLAFWLFWGEVQPAPDVLDWVALDRGLALVQSVDGDPVVVFHLGAPPPPPPGGFWAMNNGNPYTGPTDLQVGANPAWPTGQAQGYSPLLYTAAWETANRIAESGVDRAVMRFHNEAWDLWSLGEPAAWNGNANNYILSYLTFRQAIEDVDAAWPNVAFEVGHGSLPRGRLLPAELFDLGEQNAAQQPVAMQWLNAYTERNKSVIESAYGITMPIDTWAEATAYAGPAQPRNQLLDFWMANMLAWTVEGYFDFTTIHPHGKPIMVDIEKALFDDDVSAAGGTPPPVVDAEAAFELLDPTGWGVVPVGPALDQFVAEDYARKWLTLLSNGDVFCSPIIGGPHPQYIGLYQPDPYAAPPDNISPLPSNTAFTFLSGLIGTPGRARVIDEGEIAHLRFEQGTALPLIEAVWRRELFDATATAADFVIAAPPGYPDATEYDALGTVRNVYTGVAQITLSQVDQRPRIVAWMH